MTKIHDKEETLNIKLGVSNDRADEIQSVLIANSLIDFKRQVDSGETVINDGYETCEAVKATLAICATKEEALILGMQFEELTEKFNHPFAGGISGFADKFEDELTASSGDLDKLSAIILAEIKEQN